MAKLYFTINKDEKGGLCDRVFEAKSKTVAKDILRDQGLTPKMVFSWEDVCKVRDGVLEHQDMTELYQNFVISHLAEWEKAHHKTEGNSES